MSSREHRSTGPVRPEPLDTSAPTMATGPESEALLRASDASAVGRDLTSDRRYRYDSRLGQGGMGEVLLYQDSRIGRDVAVKRLRVEAEGEADTLARFIREARIQGQLEHPSLVPVYDMGTDTGGSFYFTMRRVRGRTLSDILRAVAENDVETKAHFSRRRLLTIFSSICMAVHYAHRRGVVHRDLKPSNVMVGEYGEVYVLDWGIAKVLAEKDKPASSGEPGVAKVPAPLPAPVMSLSAVPVDSTRAGSIMGTVGYMAPEQLLGQTDRIDPRSDVYSLGLILYQILTLRPPFDDASNAPALLLSMERGVNAPSLADTSVPPELDEVVKRATAFDQENRYRTAKELSEVIERQLDGARDEARRRELAATQVDQAESALLRAERMNEADGHKQRLAAMSSLLKAMALTPDDERARGVLLRLLTHIPTQMPQAVVDEMAKSVRHTRLQGLRLGIGVYVSWLFVIAYTLFMGVRSWPMFWFCTVQVLLNMACTTYFYKTGKTSDRELIVLAVMAFAVIASFAVWLGPFVLVPMAMSSGALLFCSQAKKRVRYTMIAIAVTMVTAPFVVEWLGVLPPAYEFRPGELVLKARAVEITPFWTMLGLVYLSVSFTAVPAWYMGRLKDSLDAAERRVFLHAWHFNQLTKVLSEKQQPKEEELAKTMQADL